MGDAGRIASTFARLCMAAPQLNDYRESHRVPATYAWPQLEAKPAPTITKLLTWEEWAGGRRSTCGKPLEAYITPQNSMQLRKNPEFSARTIHNPPEVDATAESRRLPGRTLHGRCRTEAAPPLKGSPTSCRFARGAPSCASKGNAGAFLDIRGRRDAASRLPGNAAPAHRTRVSTA